MSTTEKLVERINAMNRRYIRKPECKATLSEAADALEAKDARIAELESQSESANLIAIIADIREKSGVGARPMLGELADAIGARIDELETTLEPFASISELVYTETEGLSDDDEFGLMFHDYLLDRFTLHHFRRAASARGRE